MGATIYGFLTESFLFEDALIEDQFQGISEKEIRKELQAYREYCISHFSDIENEANEETSVLKIFSVTNKVGLRLLKQSAFYVDQQIIQDPLFPFTHEGGAINKALGEYLQCENHDIDRRDLSSVLKFLKALTPMVVANYVRFLPTSYLYEPKEQPPVYYSENLFADLLPPTLMQFFRQRATVRSLRKTERGWAIEEGLTLSRGIAVQFGNDWNNEARMYHLFETQFNDFDDTDNSMKIAMSLLDSPPSASQFGIWVEQSINRAASDICEKVVSEVGLGEKFGAAYMTDSVFVSDLMRQVHGASDSIALHTADTLINMELPFLDNVDLETLMKVRQNDGQAFKNFRLELDCKLRELRLEKDKDKFKVRLSNAIHEIRDVQLHKIGEKVSAIKRESLAEAAILTAGLCGTYQLEGLSLLVGGVALARGYRTVAQYWKEVRQNPSFFLWKVKGK